MHRSRFLRLLALGAASTTIPLRAMNDLIDSLPKQDHRMPAVFVGHGSPMNALSDNSFTRGWEHTAAAMPRPSAILCISAHWETRGTHVTAMPHPETIHDFGGFPRALFEVQYPAPGAPALAADARRMITRADVGLDNAWGIDHGTWSVLVKMYPKADIPVVQLSLDRGLGARAHYELAQQLAPLRDRGVLVMGSGNVVHNLRYADLSDDAAPYDWAVEFDETVRRLVLAGDHASLIAWETLGSAARLSIPTPEHYLPLLYILALQKKDDQISFPVEGLAFRSGSMRSVLLA